MKPSDLRWGVVFLLVLMSLVTLLDRSAGSLLMIFIEREMHFTTLELGQILALTAVISGCAALAGGWMIDRIGTRWGMALSLLICLTATLGETMISSVFGLALVRGIFAAGAPANYLAANKAISEHIAPQGRGTAIAVYSLGPRITTIIAPVLIVTIVNRLGWRFVLLVLSILAGFSLLLWLWRYRSPQKDAAEPLLVEPINFPAPRSWIDRPEEKNEKSFWRSRTVWLLILSNALTGEVGSFLTSHITEPSNQQLRAWQFISLFLFSVIGTLGSGIISDYGIRAGKAPAASRTQIMSWATILMLFCCLIPLASSTWAIVILTALISLGNAGWLVMMTSLILDVTPVRSVGMAMGMIVATSGLLSVLLMNITKFFMTNDAAAIFLIVALQLLAFWLVRLATRCSAASELVT